MILPDRFNEASECAQVAGEASCCLRLDKQLLGHGRILWLTYLHQVPQVCHSDLLVAGRLAG
jgi:hypothetical protein